VWVVPIHGEAGEPAPQSDTESATEPAPEATEADTETQE